MYGGSNGHGAGAGSDGAATPEIIRVGNHNVNFFMADQMEGVNGH